MRIIQMCPFALYMGNGKDDLHKYVLTYGTNKVINTEYLYCMGV